MEDAPETVVLSGTPSVESGNSQEFNPYAGTGAYQQPMMPVPQKNDSATYSMWLGISTWVLWFLGFIVGCTICLTPLTSIAGIVLGHQGLQYANERSQLGRGEAIAGLVMNYLSLLLLVGSVVLGAAIFGAIGVSLT
jgi:hypothetical protein